MKKYNVQSIKKGLSDLEAEQSKKEHGKNIFSARKPKSFLRCFFENLGDLGIFFENLVFANGNSFINASDKSTVLNNIYLIILAAVFSMPILPWIKKKLKSAPEAVISCVSVATTISCVLLLLVCAVLLAENTTNPFLYFRF